MCEGCKKVGVKQVEIEGQVRDVQVISCPPRDLLEEEVTDFGSQFYGRARYNFVRSQRINQRSGL